MRLGKVLIADGDRAVVQALEAQIRTLGLEPLWTPDGQEVIDLSHIENAARTLLS